MKLRRDVAKNGALSVALTDVVKHDVGRCRATRSAVPQQGIACTRRGLVAVDGAKHDSGVGGIDLHPAADPRPRANTLGQTHPATSVDNEQLTPGMRLGELLRHA